MSLPAIPQFTMPDMNSAHNSALAHPHLPQMQSIPSSQVYTTYMAPAPTPQAIYLNCDMTPSINWYPDSGASHHVTPTGVNI